MPTADAIVKGLTTIANEWRVLAIGWHLLLGTLLLAVWLGWRPARRHLGYLLVAPLMSVSIVAWISGNPFNGAVFLLLAVVLLLAARRFPGHQGGWPSSPLMTSGVVLLAFAWSYPHFVNADRWAEYAYAAPLGLVPCPTLAALIGLTLILGLLRPALWAATLVAAAVVYGMVGVFTLGVLLDYGLLAGAGALAVALFTRTGAAPSPPDCARGDSLRRPSVPSA
jgi:hypothetical protein